MKIPTGLLQIRLRGRTSREGYTRLPGTINRTRGRGYDHPSSRGRP